MINGSSYSKERKMVPKSWKTQNFDLMSMILNSTYKEEIDG